jgi:hypothetical protein
MKTTIKSFRIETELLEKLKLKKINVSKEIKSLLEKLADSKRCPTCNQKIVT